MRFDLDHTLAILERTPAVLNTLLRGLPEDWTAANEGPETWSAFDVVGHLIHGEKTDWVPRTRIILTHGPAQPFEPYDRFAQQGANVGRPLDDLLDEFATLRAQNLKALRELRLVETDFPKRGTHPELGPVTLGQLLAAWTVHDLGHITQVSRVMAKRYTEDVGPWHAYLAVLSDRTAS